MSLPSSHNVRPLEDHVVCRFPMPKPPPSAYDHVVTIATGQNEARKEFHVHRGLLSYYSGYFKNMLNGNFRESQMDHQELPHISANIFHMFYSWLYTGIVVMSDNTSEREIDPEHLVEMYILGEYCLAPDFQNRAMDLLVLCTPQTIRNYDYLSGYLYENTHKFSPMRRLWASMVNEGVMHVGGVKAELEKKHLPRELLEDMVVELIAESEKDGSRVKYRTRSTKVCKFYHVHPHQDDYAAGQVHR